MRTPQQKLEDAINAGKSIMMREFRACCRPRYKEPHFVTKTRTGNVVKSEAVCTRCGKETITKDVV